jgi:hypothetical protein
LLEFRADEQAEADSLGALRTGHWFRKLGASLAAGFVAFVILSGAVPAISGAAPPAENWIQQAPASSPPARYAASSAFDTSSNQTVLFGGRGEPPAAVLGDTWTWNDGNWAEEAPAISPPARERAMMTFHPSTGESVLFGGFAAGFLGDTWTWDGTNWTQESPANSPPARDGAAMALDPATGNVLLFGGSDNEILSDTWAWDGSNWTQLFPATSPPKLYLSQMATDTSAGNILLFGGFDGTYRSDTWIWDGSNWSQRSPATSPPGRNGAGMTFDPSSERVLLFGGYDSTYLNDTWTWDGSTWVQKSPATNPAAASLSSMVTDVANEKILLFGGIDNAGYSDDTWTYGVKASPVLSVSGATSGEVGSTIKVDAELTAGSWPTGTITFLAYPPSDTTCSGTPAFTSGAPVSGNGDYATPGFAPDTAGDYRWTAAYSGDANNEPATTVCGATGSISTVVEVPPVVCSPAKLNFSLRGFRPSPPFGRAQETPGVRVRIATDTRSDAKISPSIRYRAGGRTRTAALEVRTVQLKDGRAFRFGVPKAARRQIRKSTGRLYGTKVTLRMKARLKLRDEPDSCYRPAITRSLRTRIINVSSQVALRRGN